MVHKYITQAVPPGVCAPLLPFASPSSCTACLHVLTTLMASISSLHVPTEEHLFILWLAQRMLMSASYSHFNQDVY